MEKSPNNSKFSSPKKLVKKVFGLEKDLEHENESNPLENELIGLKEQISLLQMTVLNLQEETEEKEEAIANLARDKQKMYKELKRERRSSVSLKQQLGEERQFYFNEKKTYCHQMNDCKKIRKRFNDHVECRKEIASLKESLSKTLEANYNLSIKFLRIRNAKLNLKSRLKRVEENHQKAMQDLQAKISNIKNELLAVTEKRFGMPIPPSSKKYLQIVKQNGILVHENLNLQRKIDALSLEMDSLRLKQLKSESQTSLKYINSKTREKLGKSSGEPCKTDDNSVVREITTKIFEREVKKDMPQIVLMDDYNDFAEGISKIDPEKELANNLDLMQISSP